MRLGPGKDPLVSGFGSQPDSWWWPGDTDSRLDTYYRLAQYEGHETKPRTVPHL